MDWIVAERTKIAQKYLNAFKDISCIRLPKVDDGDATNWQSFSIYLKPECPIGRNDLMQKLLDQGIASRRGIMTSHRETAYKNHQLRAPLPISENECDNSIIIPLFVPMKEEDIQTVIREFKALLIPQKV